jgi:hypothetical protein
MYDFSLIDIMENGFSNIPEASVGKSNMINLNSVIKEALHVYNKEVLNISKINQNMDRLHRKNEKLINQLNNMNVTLLDASKYVASNYNDNNVHYNNITYNIKSMRDNLDSCMCNINEYTIDESKIYKDTYDESLSTINSLNEVFTIAKFNKHSCPICLRNESTHFTLPCGHVYCKECSQKITVTCFICRQNVFKVNPLFFS